MSRDAVYDAAARGDLPVVRVGRRVLFKTADLRRMVGLDAAAPVDRRAGLAALADRVGAE
jgi:excisionase family DNA binding protein